MNTKVLILLAWICYYAFRQTADDFWLFCLIYSGVLATCTFLYGMEHKPRTETKNKK
jgi:hypothetical protein